MEWSDLPQYRSHKIVRAAPIVELRALPSLGYFNVQLEIAPGETTTKPVDASVFVRGRPEPGDYLVAYADGYVSWSPKAAFEDGYRPVADEPEPEGEPDVEV
jgi:hypothetical protein